MTVAGTNRLLELADPVLVQERSGSHGRRPDGPGLADLGNDLIFAFRALRKREGGKAALSSQVRELPDEVEFIRRLCPEGAHRHARARELLESLLQVPLEAPTGAGRARRRRPEGAAREEYVQLRAELAWCHLRLTFKWATFWSWGRSASSWGDLVGEGVLGLLKAIDRFDASHGASFATYSLLWLRSGMRRAAALNEPMVRLPFEALLDGEARRSLPASLREPLVSLSDVTIDEADELLSGRALREHRDARADADLVEVLEPHLVALPPRHRDILHRRFALEQTLAEVGLVYGVNRERIRQLEAEALEFLGSQDALRELARERGWGVSHPNTTPLRLANPNARSPRASSQPATDAVARPSMQGPSARAAGAPSPAEDVWQVPDADLARLLESPLATASVREIPGASGLAAPFQRLGVVTLADLLRLSQERARTCPGVGRWSMRRLAQMRDDALARLQRHIRV